MDETSKTENLEIDHCAQCGEEIIFGEAEIDLRKHDRKIKGWMAICSKCGNTHFDSETTKVLIVLGYVQVVTKNDPDAKQKPR